MSKTKKPERHVYQNRADLRLCQQIRKHCEEHGISACQLQSETGISTETIYRIVVAENRKGYPKYLYQRTRDKLKDWLEAAQELDYVEPSGPYHEPKQEPKQEELPLEATAEEASLPFGALDQIIANSDAIARLERKIGVLDEANRSLALSVLSLQREALKR